MIIAGNQKMGVNNHRDRCLSLFPSFFLSFALSLLVPIFLFSCANTRQIPSADSLNMHQTSIGLVEAVICKDIREGEEASPIDETPVFTIQDKQAVMWFKVNELKKKHTLRWKWYDPQGNLYYDTQDFSIGSEDQQYKAATLWHKIGIFGEKAADLFGDWQVKLDLDGKELITKNFKIVGDLNPVITYFSPATPAVHEKDLQLKARVEDEIGLKDVQIKVNGDASKVIVQPGSKVITIENKIPLREGENKIEIIASNSYRKVTKSKDVVYAKKQNIFSGDSLYKDSYALIVGIDNYEYIPKLSYAVADARGVKDILIQDLGFSEDHITYLTNQEATRGNILRYLGDEFPKKTGEEDRVFVFFSGHGYTRKVPTGGEMGYLMPVEAKANNIHSTAISMAEIRDISNLITAKHILFVVDACYSGLVGMQLRNVGGIKDSAEHITKITKNLGRQILTAGKADEQVVESDQWGHSVYTKFLIQGLKQRDADSNQDGLITATELHSYLEPRVTKESGSRQTPQIRYMDGEGEFVFPLQ